MTQMTQLMQSSSEDLPDRCIHAQPLYCLLHQKLRHRVDTAGSLIDGNLAVCPRSLGIIKQDAQVVDLAPAAQVIQHIIHEVQQLPNSIAHAEATALYEVDELRIQTMTYYAPLILIDEIARQHMRRHPALMQPCQFCNECLAERCNGDGILKRGGHITNTKFNSVEKRMGANIPPDFLGVVDTPGPNKALDIGVVCAPRGKYV